MTDLSAEKSIAMSFDRDVREWIIPEEVMAILLKDRTTGKNIIWATDDYIGRGYGFGAPDEIRLEQIVNREDPVILPRVDKSKDERKRRIVNKAEVFTPSWICNMQNNLVDAAWFEWKKPDSSPFNVETKSGWNTSTTPIHFSQVHSWRDYVKVPRLEVSCGEAPYLASRYDAATGHLIQVSDRVGLLDRKLRVVFENADDTQDWLYYAKRAVQGCYGFEWQGDNVLLARENVLATVIEHYNTNILGKADSVIRLPIQYLIELAEIISWNIWQMDGIKLVVPNSCKPEHKSEAFLDGTIVTLVSECPGCKAKGIRNHNGTYCMVMDWQASPNPVPIRFVDLMGGNR